MIPTGGGWSEPRETVKKPGELFATELKGPRGTTLIIQHTPLERAVAPRPANASAQIGQPAFGSATEYVFKGGVIPICQRSTCVDYIVNDDASDRGFAVLVGGDDLAYSKEVGRAVMESLTD